MRIASPWCGNVTITRRPWRTIPASSSSASACPRAAIAGRCASKSGPASAEGRRAAPPSERRVRVPPPPTRATSSICQTRSGGAVERRSVLGRRPREKLVRDALGGRVDGRVHDRMERALRERREGAHLLDLVAEELDAERLAPGAREDVHEPAANRDLPTLLDPLRALVPGRRERLDERIEPSRRPRGGESRRALGLWGHAFCERARRHAHEPAAREDGERARALADEVGRGSSPDPSPTPRLGSSAMRAGSAYQQTASAASRASSSSGSRQTSARSSLAWSAARTSGERGLRDARIRREVVDERGEALACGELLDETVEGRLPGSMPPAGTASRRAIVPRARSHPARSAAS